jgi:two-component system phosphate regulon sensor histidine kinase PhoR
VARRPLIWQLFPAYLLVTLAASGALTIYAAQTARDFHLGRIAAELRERAALLLPQFTPLFDRGAHADMDALCKTLGQVGNMRITAILPDGSVAGDSHSAPGAMENHASRPEVVDALGGATGESLRASATMQEAMMYAALPVGAPGNVRGVLRVALPVATIQQTLTGIYVRFGIAGATLALLTGLLSFWAVRRIIAPLDRLKSGAERFAQGALDQPLAVPQTQEFAGLAEAMNTMAGQLSERMRRAVQQSNQLRAVLQSMVEGVLAVDNAGRIISVNDAAASLLGLSAERMTGQPLETAVRNVALQQFVGRALASLEPIESEIVLHAGEEQVLQAHGTVLNDAAGVSIGALVVLNDITRVRRLESVRSDFVANVSHELKTPITNIKGFVETLLDGAMESPEECERFLRIVAKHADRLNNIIEDLLTLSRIEQGGGGPDDGFLVRANVVSVVRGTIQLCASGAAAREIAIDLAAPDEVLADINPPLLEQGIFNLIDNATKYSGPGSRIRVAVRQDEAGVDIDVTDQGVGIAAEHLPRLFERFYRVDKARSRGVGGTGLGLAIVKHIAQSHLGRVSVESQPGHGSTFTFHLPPSAA